LQEVSSVSFKENILTYNSRFSYYDSRFIIINCFFNLINDLILTEKSLKLKKELTDLNLDIGYVLKTPKTYLLQFLGHYDDLIESLKNNRVISTQIEELKALIESRFTQTSELFPKLIKLFKSLDIIEQIDSEDYERQFQLLNDTTGVNNKLVKSIIIKNLVKSEDKKSNLINVINNQIIDLIQKRRDEISFSVNLKKTETLFSEEAQLLIDIKSKLSGEGQNLEFKETLLYPVFTNDERKKIEHLTKEIENNSPKSEEFKILIDKMTSDKLKLRKNKEIHRNLAHSAIKNICAFLNSNNGKVIIGVRDDNSLIGLSPDLELFEGDFDSFSRSFEDYWKKFVVDSAIFRPFVTLKKVTFESKVFCFIDVKYPHEIKEPCFIRTDNQEKCIVKNSSTTDYLNGKALRTWKRIPISQNKEPNYVYIMIDKYGHYKIGLAKNPKRRAGTLMSQDNKIKLIKTYIFPSREIARNLEKHLHNKYNNLRTETNSEWFQLEDAHLDEIEVDMQTQMEYFPQDKPDNILDLSL
jgi:hypothetical protein